MRAVVLLAMLMFVLRGCASDKMDADDDKDVMANAEAPDAMSDLDTRDPFVTGSSYRFVMTAKTTPGLEHSHAAVKISVRGFVVSDTEEITEEDNDNTDNTDTGNEASRGGVAYHPDDSKSLAANSKLRLDWVCGKQQERGHQEVEMSRLDVRLSIALKKLPALKRASDSIKCEVEATLDTTRGDGERIIVTGSHEFYIEMDVLYPAIKLHDLEITADTNDATRSVVAFKVALIRQGKTVVQGDPVFDNEVEVDLTWVCNDAPEPASRSKSDDPKELVIAAGKAEDKTQFSMPSPNLGEGGYACMIEASAAIDGYEEKVEGKKKIWIEGKDLQVAVTAVTSTSLNYAVMQRYQKLDSNIKLSIEGAGCAGVTLSSGDSTVTSKGTVDVSGTGTGCQLKAQVMDNGTAVREGVSNKTFSISSALQ